MGHPLYAIISQAKDGTETVDSACERVASIMRGVERDRILALLESPEMVEAAVKAFNDAALHARRIDPRDKPYAYEIRQALSAIAKRIGEG